MRKKIDYDINIASLNGMMHVSSPGRNFSVEGRVEVSRSSMIQVIRSSRIEGPWVGSFKIVVKNSFHL